MAADRLKRGRLRRPRPAPWRRAPRGARCGGLRGREPGGTEARGEAAAVGRPPARAASSSPPPTADGAPGRTARRWTRSLELHGGDAGVAGDQRTGNLGYADSPVRRPHPPQISPPLLAFNQGFKR